MGFISFRRQRNAQSNRTKKKTIIEVNKNLKRIKSHDVTKTIICHFSIIFWIIFLLNKILNTNKIDFDTNKILGAPMTW